MSARERSRYLTVTVVFLAVLIVLGSLMVKTAIVMAQAFTFRPQAGTSNTYSSTSSTQNLSFAFDPNTLTAATTYTNADFSDDGITPDASFTWSGRWAAFAQTTTLLKNIGLYVIREGLGNDTVDQWTIEYSIDGIGGTWFTLDDAAGSGDNPAKGEVTTFPVPGAIPNTTDLLNDFVVMTTSKQINATDAKLNIYDIRVEAEWNEIEGGPYPLRIDSPDVLADGVKDAAYTPETIVASGGNSPYSWCLLSGSLPSGMTFTPALSQCPTGAPNPTVDLSGTPTVAGDFTFKIRVTDSSSTTQIADKEYTLHIAGLSIDPPGPSLRDWVPIVVGASSGQTFTPEGGSSPYDWCLVSGSIPPGTSWSPALATCDLYTTTAPTVDLTGTPTDPGVYSFTIRLSDSGGETPAEHHYVAEVSSSYVTILKRLLKPVVKGISYGKFLVTQMTPQYLRAINVQYSIYATDVSWSATGLPTGFDLYGTTLNTITETSSVYIGGTIDVGENSGTYTFDVTVDDNGVHQDTEKDFKLEVLERRTLLRRTPPSAVVLPADPTASNYHTLDFLVSATGGVPNVAEEDEPDNVDGSSIPYYTYYWEVTPVDGAPALAPPSGTASGETPNPPYEPGPLLVPITFEDSVGAAVTGTYVITFRARDYLRRIPANSSDSDYEFVPATARIKIMSPAGGTLEKDATRPTLLRQEQFR